MNGPASIYLQGLSLGGSLIIAIGAQNAFVLSQGIRGRFRLPITLICCCIDAILITAGTLGVGSALSSNILVMTAASIGGAAFLIYYGFTRFRAVFSDHTIETEAHGPETLQAAILTTLAVSLLNPHVYLDTLLLIGSVSSSVPDAQRPLFAMGAASASGIWFFCLCYGGTYLAPLFSRPLAWKVLDLLIGCIMWTIAGSLILQML